MYLKIEYLFISFAVHACWRTLSLTVGAGSYNRILFNDFLKVAKSGYSALDHTMHQSFLPFSLASVAKRLVVSCSTSFTQCLTDGGTKDGFSRSKDYK